MSKIVIARFSCFKKEDIGKVIDFSSEVPQGILSVKKRSSYARELRRFGKHRLIMGLIAHPAGNSGTKLIIAHTLINRIQYSENNRTTPLLINQQDLDLSLEKSKFGPNYNLGWQDYSFYFDRIYKPEGDYDIKKFERSSQAILFPS